MVTSDQLWLDVLFAHWRISPNVVSKWLPANVELDTWEGEAWVSVVAQHVRRFSLPRFPMLRGYSFDAVDVRTYVRHEGVASIFLLSIDVSCARFARAAAFALGLPCRKSELKIQVRDESIVVRAKRAPWGETFATRARFSEDRPRAKAASSQRFFLERDAVVWKKGPLLVEVPFTGPRFSKPFSGASGE